MLLSPNLNLLEDNYDQDHSHADVLFNDQELNRIGITNNRIEMWKEKKSHLPNLSFMQESRNKSKNKTDLKTWMDDNPDKISSLKLLPLTSYELKNFEKFYILRRSMMKYSLCDIFGVEKEEINIGSLVSLNCKYVDNTFIGNVGMYGVVKNINDDKCTVDFETDDRIITANNVPLKFLYIVEDFDKKLKID